MIDLEPAELQGLMDQLRELVGADWLDKKIATELAQRQFDKEKIHQRKNAFLFRNGAHPLIIWWLFTAGWVNDWGKSAIPEAAFRIAALARSLISSARAVGFEKVVPRLRRESEFYSASFEATVAAGYLDRGCEVEFVAEEQGKKTPDLKVVIEDGTAVWVECKCRDELIERDRRIRSFWDELQSSLMRRFGPDKTNVIVAIRCRGEPERDDLEGLRNFIFDQVEKNPHLNVFRGALNLANVSYLAGKYEVVAQVIAPPDEEYDVAEFGISSPEEFDYFVTFMDRVSGESALARIRNPSHYAFKTDTPSDGVPGLINAFKSAVKQLPESGPGVVWLKVPDGGWGRDVSVFLERLSIDLQKELSGEHNRRVNAVVVLARGFDRGELNGEGTYRAAQRVIQHTSPRFVIGDGRAE